jgi:hypothetical protein
VRRYDGQAWQEIVKIDSKDLADVSGNWRNAIVGAPMAMDRSGNLVAAWIQFDGEFTNLWSAKFDRSTSTWSPATKLENAPFDVRLRAVAVNSSGVVTTIWVQPDATLFHVYASRTTLAPAGAPAAAQGFRTMAPLAVQGSLPVRSISVVTSPRESTTVVLAARLASEFAPLRSPNEKSTKAGPAKLHVSLVDAAFRQDDLLDDLLGTANPLQP